jgi:hypothetical protein
MVNCVASNVSLCFFQMCPCVFCPVSFEFHSLIVTARFAMLILSRKD